MITFKWFINAFLVIFFFQYFDGNSTDGIFGGHEESLIAFKFIFIVSEFLDLFNVESSDLIDDIFILFEQWEFFVDFFHVIKFGPFLENGWNVRFSDHEFSMLGFDHVVLAFCPGEDIAFLSLFHFFNSLFIPSFFDLKHLDLFFLIIFGQHEL